MRKSVLVSVLAIAIFSGFYSSAQVAWLKPESPKITDTATLWFNASEGNKALMDYIGDVYLHTGVITNKSLDGHDWKYVVGNWGTDDKRVIMKRESKNLYSFRFIIKEFYPLKPEDIAQQLAYVFRSQDGGIVGKTAGNEDILVPVYGYKPKTEEPRGLNRQVHKLQKVEEVKNGWNLFLDKGIVSVRPYSDEIIEVTFLPEAQAKPDRSYAVVMAPEKVSVSSTKTSAGYELRCGKMCISVTANPYFLTFIYDSDTLLSEESGFYTRPGNTGVRFALKSKEKIFGTGERALAMDRRGKKLPLYNRPSYGYEYGATQLNYSIPLTFSSRKYALLFDNPQKGYVDIGLAEPNVTEWNALGGTARYYVIAGSSFPKIIENYTLLTGRQSLPPRWALGNLQSRMAYRNQEQTELIVSMMKKKNFPVDAVILDFYWFGDSIQGHLGKLDWFKPAWPDPVGMIAKFKKQGIKTILITEPYVIDTVVNYKDAAAKGVFVTDSLGNPYLDKQFYFGTGSLIDIFKPAAQDWFWQKYQKQIKIGVAGWWGDLGEPESHPSDIYHINGKADQVHNIYGHYWDKMLFEKYAEYYPDTRLFHLQRSGFAGSQRYSAFPWTGDVSRGWGGFKAQLPLLLTMSMSGLGYIHSDAGGFAQGVRDDELYTRWLQFAVFTPILRPHGSVIPSEPVFWSEQTQDIMRNYMNLRYALLPYNYTLAWQNTTSGAPLMRPLLYAYANDTTTLSIEDEYLWGENLLVAPVLKKGINSRNIYLPEGDWIDFHSGIAYTGRKWIEYPLTIENMPVFAKAGSFIPMTKPVTSTDFYKADNYVVRYYPAGKTSFVQYEDNGLDNHSLRDHKYELITYTGICEAHSTKVQISKKGKWDKMPSKRNITLEIYIRSIPSKVLLNSKIIEQKPAGNPVSFSIPTYSFDGKVMRLYMQWSGQPVSVEIKDAK